MNTENETPRIEELRLTLGDFEEVGRAQAYPIAGDENERPLIKFRFFKDGKKYGVAVPYFDILTDDETTVDDVARRLANEAGTIVQWVVVNNGEPDWSLTVPTGTDLGAAGKDLDRFVAGFAPNTVYPD